MMKFMLEILLMKVSPHTRDFSHVSVHIGETYITVENDYKTGEELDVFFSELKDVRLIK